MKEEPRYFCNICGRGQKHKIKAFGKVWCNKHYKQFKKYGYVLDNNPRTIYDKNEIRIEGKIAYMDLYDKRCNVIATTIFDAEDVEKVKYTKWKLSGSGYVMNAPKFMGGSKHISRVILGTDEFVEYNNHNTLDNRKENLRIVTKSQNQMNSNYKGVTERADGKYYAHIKINGKMANLGVYVFKEEAYFARWYAETLLFKEFRYLKEKPVILERREKEIKEYVDRKVQRLPLSV